VRCYRCGQENFEGASFCFRCGATLAVRPERTGERPSSHSSQRPFGIVFIVIWTIISGIGYLFLSVYIGIIGGFIAGAVGSLTGSEVVGTVIAVLTILFFLLGVLMISGAIGLWQLAEWGRQLIIWTRAVELLIGFVTLGIGSAEEIRRMGISSVLMINGLFEIVVSIIIISYLVREETKVLFQQGTTTPREWQPPRQQQVSEYEWVEPPSPQVSLLPPLPQPQTLPANLVVWLEVVQGLNVGQRFFVLKPDNLVGRSNESDIQILEPSVSRRHFRLKFEHGQFLLENESNQGTYVNGQPVMGWQPLKDGDYIQAGRVVFQFRIQGRA